MTNVFRYTALPGDTVSSVAAGISASAGITYRAIEAANPDVTSSAIPVGTLLNIPARGGSNTVLRYTAMEGDTYSQIARQLAERIGITTRQIVADNPDIDPNSLTAGQQLNIPTTVSAHEMAPDPASDTMPEEQVGFWRWTWSHSPTPPANCNLGLAFSGWTDIENALQQSAAVYTTIPDPKYITLGGGNSNGAFDATSLQKVTDAINADRFASYVGVAYDIEEGSSGLAAAFAESFASAKQQGLSVLVTVSHSAPYGIGDANALMQSIFSDPNIDLLSPQLYTTGFETKNDYATSHGVTWDMYTAAKAQVIPSIVKADMYADAQAYFEQQGVTLSGFVQWSQS